MSKYSYIVFSNEPYLYNDTANTNNDSSNDEPNSESENVTDDSNID